MTTRHWISENDPCDANNCTSRRDDDDGDEVEESFERGDITVI